MFNIQRKCALSILLVAVVCMAATANAQSVNFCFYADAPVPDPNVQGTVGVLGGGYWNIGGPFSNRNLNLSWTDLSDTSGNATDVDFSLQTSEWAQNGGSGGGTGPNGALWSRYIYQGGTTNFTIGGLSPDAVYDMVLYSHWGGWGDAETGFNINNDGGGVKIADDDGTKDWDTGFIEDENYVRFASVTASANGEITGQMFEVEGSERWNGFQISQIPEPGSLVLIATGLLGLALVAWRKRRSR